MPLCCGKEYRFRYSRNRESHGQLKPRVVGWLGPNFTTLAGKVQIMDAQPGVAVGKRVGM